MSDAIDKMVSFERAFTSNSGGCRRDCHCGRVFYDGSGTGGWDWEDGELEELEKNPKATAVDYTVGTVVFGGVEYCADCDCWHEAAAKRMAWLDAHGEAVCHYFTLEKERKTRVAANAPTVKP